MIGSVELLWYCCHIKRLEKTEGAIKNGQSREIGNIVYKKNPKQNKTHTHIHTTQYVLDTTIRKQKTNNENMSISQFSSMAHSEIRDLIHNKILL